MREIKFRGKTLAGFWAEGYLTNLIRSCNGVEAGYYISNDVGMPFAYQVRPETIGQFTGLYTVDKKEIYEGDIIKFLGKWDENGNVVEPDYTPHEVFWMMGGFVAAPVNRDRFSSFQRDLKGVGHTNSKLLGDIYDNPELLTKADKPV